jgi:hypothetical protein
MADQKISAMPSAATLTGAELIPLVQSGANVQSTLSSLATFSYGANAAFEDYTTQNLVSANTPKVVTFDTTSWATGVTLVSGSQLRVTNAGKYNFQFSIQFGCTSVQLQDIYVWLRKNGTNIGGSTGLVSVPNSHGGVDGHAIVGWNFFLDLAANDYIQLVWTSASTTVNIRTLAAGASWPSTASVVMTINQVA